ncbi:GNAT family N-acetyltransferase [Nocardioides sp. URHA0020]|uniref:GNAT family N-acetyltransferase n=1 Tax=Nocardioides sp. URHA0020 TaxID=1380392 RepID=UPI0006853423|nr:GNAT family N-acetyltransferase [Nocardioides sp. URHA0020]
MDDAELERVRAHLGTVLATLAARIGAVADAGPGWWIGLTGGVAPELNLALLTTPDVETLDGTLAIVEDAGLAALVLLAGPGRGLADRLGSPWATLPAVAVMTRDLTTGPRDAPDRRVRQAGPADAEVVADLVAAAHSLTADDTAITVAAALPGGVVRAWLLEEDGLAVSAVVSGHLDDAVSLWALSTPPAFAGRGYGRALLAGVLAQSRADGARLGMLAATPAGVPLYEASGWRIVEEWDLVTNAGSAPPLG